MKHATCLSFLGTGSDVGKSFVVAGICRALKNRGFSVAPFKAQNMSNNSFVTLDGLEMGRAQVVQAEASGIEPEVDMNPVLLKPSGDCRSQVVLQGKVVGSRHAKDYYKQTDALFAKAMESLNRLRERHDVIVMEGAGSCSEVNLRSRDIVNFRPAHETDAPVILIADIDRGGVFAQIVGTLEVIPPEDRARIAGILINRFRGDISLFEDGVRWIEERTGLPVLGVISYNREILIDSEDGMDVQTQINPSGALDPDKINIATILFPRISNHTDLAALQCEPGVEVHFLTRPKSLVGYDLLILPGSKNVRSDLEWMRKNGWEERINAFAQSGGSIGGICGGYQMMGQSIQDPHGVEGSPGAESGLGLLPTETVLAPEKRLTRNHGTWIGNRRPVHGYEIHMGRTRSSSEELRPAIAWSAESATAEANSDGLSTPDGKIWGTYLHGLFDSGPFRQEFLSNLRPDWQPPAQQNPLHLAPGEDFENFKARQYDRLGDHIEKCIDVEKLIAIGKLHCEIC
ncbi:cobyric acid synthase [Puniceicoccus vermicola]|uniref:Cobyric acid synthase n=1 Tax=Puniceicoccus vermicola TaxID=388746 RepID=A0A7X1E4U2_9BACT|nr:cobyric acid synthase [Puniceicoccus vermicola]MBC2602885.1 cobyric acid synthase [Puniceicoccus vermicola]